MPVGQKEPNNWQTEMGSCGPQINHRCPADSSSRSFSVSKGSGFGLRADSSPRGFALS